MRLLVCGGRNFHDYEALNNALNALPFTPTILIEGGAKGADSLARAWAVNNEIHYAEVPALWSVFGKAAGTLRNEAMTLLKPEYCVSMPGGAGTRRMVEICNTRGIPVWSPYG